MENHGGLAGGGIALLVGDQFFYHVGTETYVDEQTKKFMLSSATTYGEVDSPYEGSTVFTNGIQNSLSDSMRNGAMQSGTDEFILSYSPQHDLLGDLLESFWDKNFGGIVSSGNSRQIKTFFSNGIESNTSFNIAAHSQGTLLNYRAMEGLDFTNGGNIETGSVQFSGSPVDASKFQNLVLKTGHAVSDQASKDIDYSKVIFQVNRPQGETSFFGAALVDPVSDFPIILGGNYQYGEGGSLGSAILSLPSFLSESSPHSNYICQTADCGKNGMSTSIEDFKKNIRTPDSKGKGYIDPKIFKFEKMKK